MGLLVNKASKKTKGTTDLLVYTNMNNDLASVILYTLATVKLYPT